MASRMAKYYETEDPTEAKILLCPENHRRVQSGSQDENGDQPGYLYSCVKCGKQEIHYIRDMIKGGEVFYKPGLIRVWLNQKKSAKDPFEDCHHQDSIMMERMLDVDD